MRSLILAFALCTGLAAADAIDQAERDLILRYLDLARAQEKFEIGQLAGFKVGFEMAGGSTMTPKQREKIYAVAAGVLRTEMPWERMRDELVAVYAQLYSADEMAQVVALLETDVGKLMAEREIGVIEPSMRLGQDMAKDLGPKLMEALQPILQEADGDPAKGW